LTDQDLDQLYERLKYHVEVVDDDSPGISTEEMEKMVQESNNTILQAREETRKSVAELTAQVDNINTAVRKQNVVVVALQKTLAETSLELKTSVNEKVGNLSSQIQELRSLVMSTGHPLAHRGVIVVRGEYN
jgi:methyl-accepting chemotaxis protein